jgi:hypothetical protein
MGTHHSGLVKWVQWCINVVQNKTIDKVQYAMEAVITKHRNSHFSLQSVNNFLFRVSFIIGNTPPI